MNYKQKQKLKKKKNQLSHTTHQFVNLQCGILDPYNRNHLSHSPPWSINNLRIYLLGLCSFLRRRKDREHSEVLDSGKGTGNIKHFSGHCGMRW